MKFGFTLPPVGPAGRDDAANYAQVLRDCRFGQQLGFDSAWALEHHFTPYFPTPDTLTFLAHVAALCPGLGLGTCVIVLPWHHPLRVAEQIAMLNVLSQGPLYLGLGRGTARYEFERFGVEMEGTRERFREAWEIIRQALGGEPFAFQGRYYSFPETRVRPAVRDAAALHFFGAVGSPDSAEVMADLGLPLIHTSNFPDHLALKNQQRWAARWAEQGRPAPAAGTPIHANPTIVAPTDREALEIARAYFPRFTQVQMEHYETRADYWKEVPGYEIHSTFFANLAKLSRPGPDLDKYLSSQLIGSPEKVIRRTTTLRDELGMGHVVTGHFLYEMDDGLRRRSLQLFAEKVIPHFRDAGAAA